MYLYRVDLVSRALMATFSESRNPATVRQISGTRLKVGLRQSSSGWCSSIREVMSHWLRVPRRAAGGQLGGMIGYGGNAGGYMK